MLEHLESIGNTAPVTLLFGVRYIRDIYYKEELDAYKERHPHFSYGIAVSQPEDHTWQGFKGRVTNYLEENLTIAGEKDYYLCGNGSMIESMKLLLQEQGVEKEYIHFEKYFV